MANEVFEIGTWIFLGGVFSLIGITEFKRLRSKFFPQSKEVKRENEKSTNRRTEQRAKRTDTNVCDPDNILQFDIFCRTVRDSDQYTSKHYGRNDHDNSVGLGSVRIHLHKDIDSPT